MILYNIFTIPIKTELYVIILRELLKYSAYSANFKSWICPYFTLFEI